MQLSKNTGRVSDRLSAMALPFFLPSHGYYECKLVEFSAGAVTMLLLDSTSSPEYPECTYWFPSEPGSHF
jgi:hypothetical protein